MVTQEYSVSQNEIVYEFITKKLILKEEEYKLINDFIDPTKHMKLKLLYSTAVADFNSMSFHRLCNGKGPTLTVVKSSNGKRFGGYASVSWENRQQYVRDDNAFLFSLDLKKCFKKKLKILLYMITLIMGQLLEKDMISIFLMNAKVEIQVIVMGQILIVKLILKIFLGTKILELMIMKFILF